MKRFLFIFVMSLYASLVFSESIQYNEDAWSFLFSEKGESYDAHYSENADRSLFSILQDSTEDDEKKDVASSKKNVPSYFSKMYIETLLKMSVLEKKSRKINFNGKCNAYLASSYYEAFLGFKSDEKKVLDVKVASFRFSPILMYYPCNRLSPTLSFYIGNFKTPRPFLMLQSPTIYRVRPTTQKRFFPALNAIKISKQAGDLGAACEVALPFFNFYFFWKTHDTHNSFNIYSAYRNEDLPLKKARLDIAFASSIFQEERKRKLKKNKVNTYIQLYCLSFNFESPFFYINSISTISIREKMPTLSSMSFRDEGGLKYKGASMGAGFSFSGKNYIKKYNSSKLKNNDIFAFYLQGKFKYKIFAINFSYHLLKGEMGANILHSYGIFYSLSGKYIQFKNELFVRTQLYNLKFALNFKPHLQYFSSMNVASFLYLQDKKINSAILKKYEVASSCVFPFGELLRIKLLAGISQERKDGKKFLGSINFFVSGEAGFVFSQEKWKEKLNVVFRYSTPNKSEISLKFRIEY